MVLFCGKTCGDAEIVVSLQCVFHSIRFKVNKGLGPSGDPFFVISCRFQGIKKAPRQRFFFVADFFESPKSPP